jgi:3-mercaptopyruvate sulfurtransferase SseA
MESTEYEVRWIPGAVWTRWKRKENKTKQNKNFLPLL